MLSIEDAAALSAWPAAPKARIADLLRQAPEGMCLELILEALVHDGGRAPHPEDLRATAREALAAASDAGIVPIPWGHADYPPLVAVIRDPPPLLWASGRSDCLALPAVAIVGSRVATPYGLEAASTLAGDLAGAGVLVVSGLARGVDSAAHRAALAAGGETVAVLGSGIDIIYPPEHRGLAAEVSGHGAVLSELPPGVPPHRRHFPARNRLISGLSLAVVVVEAAERSGSLITAGLALEQGRAVMAVPGSVLSGRHRGSHALIRDGAAVVESAEDVLAELRVSSLRSVAGTSAAGPGAPHPIAAWMTAGEAYDLDEIGRQTGLAPSMLLPRLLDLELHGAIRRVDGGRFVRAGRTC
jgi:DNA processing protein